MTHPIALALAGSILLLCPGGVAGPQDTPVPSAAIEVDVVALDREGRFVEGLGAADFAATVNGARRPVVWVRRVSRGPGAAAEAASRRAGAAAGVQFASEAARTVLVVIDQDSMRRGDERAVVDAARLFLDRLGLNDRVAVVTLPAASRLLNLTSERAEVRSALSQVTGRFEPVRAQARVVRPSAGDTPEQVRMSGLEVEGAISVDPMSSTRPAAGQAVESLGALFDNLSELPGRKVVAVFSAGVPAARNALVDEAARSAAAARAVVYVFGAPSRGGGPFSTAPLERLAAATGGAFLPLGRNPARVLERVAAELDACYVVGLGPAAGPSGGPASRQTLRLETPRKGVALRAAAWLVAPPDAGDQAVEAAAAAPAGPLAEAVSPTAAGLGEEDAPRKRPAAPDPELQLALARLFDYAEGYEKQYSMLVAEEDYRQSAGSGGVRIRSDLLLVRTDGDQWVSFRDVFEVDGKAVRDREERLRKLFLEATPGAMARLEAIGEESARYNVGWVERTANVPLLPLSFLRPANRDRFDYELEGRDDVSGVRAWRIRYDERARPTMIADRQHGDIPVSGSFLVDTITGAVVETRMNARRGDARAQIVVRYRSDPALGLWVPVEMRESYSRPEAGGTGRGLVRRSVVSGRATYSNFRRFQVTTGEAIAPPK